MPTRIYFAAGPRDRPLRIDVEEEPGKVFEAWKDANGMAFELTENANKHKLWVNPATVAYWEEAPSGTASY